MKRLVWNELDEAERSDVLARPKAAPIRRCRRASARSSGVRARPDAVVAYAERVDGAAPRLVPVAGPAEEARRRLSDAERAALDLAFANITAFIATACLPSNG